MIDLFLIFKCITESIIINIYPTTYFTRYYIKNQHTQAGQTFISSFISNTVHMSKNYHSLVKHLSFLCFYLFSENFILYILFIFSPLPSQNPFRSTHPYSPKFTIFPPLKKNKRCFPHQKRAHIHKKREIHGVCLCWPIIRQPIASTIPTFKVMLWEIPILISTWTPIRRVQM